MDDQSINQPVRQEKQHQVAVVVVTNTGDMVGIVLEENPHIARLVAQAAATWPSEVRKQEGLPLSVVGRTTYEVSRDYLLSLRSGFTSLSWTLNLNNWPSLLPLTGRFYIIVSI